MKRILLSIVLLCFVSLSHAALNPAEKRLVAMLESGDLSQLKSAAKQIEGRGGYDQQVLDVAAEVLLQVYPDAWDGQIDTLSWLARALGSSHNGRYYDALQEVRVGAPHKKLTKHAKKALKELGPAQGEQYRRGMVKIPTNDYQ
ncbi:hypothetical protein [Halioxenophilus aromaticivorans]|uniref:HEAT repeat domain-containing protein n=1 Tax=Halioxenophilus aromaticivorans TaxID=1306992 RepID=A0AAV3U4D8_9ALTE